MSAVKEVKEFASKLLKKSHLLEAIKKEIDTDGDGELDIEEITLFIGKVVQSAVLIRNSVK